MENTDIDDSSESEESPAGGSDSQPPKARPVALRELAAELAGGALDDDQSDDDDSSESEEHAEDGGEEKKPPKTLAEAAERLGIDVAELYKLRLPDNHKEGESQSLGDLQNEYDKRGEFAVTQLKWEEERSAQQSELLRAQQELEEILRHVPKQLLEGEALKAAQTRLNARITRERDLTLKAIPDWKSEQRYTADTAGMMEYMSGFGFPKEALSRINDHRMLLLIRESWQRKVRTDNALALIEKLHDNDGQPTSSTRKAAKKKQQQSTRRSTPAQKRQELIGLMQPSEG